jgi:hypothetical protein
MSATRQPNYDRSGILAASLRDEFRVCFTSSTAACREALQGAYPGKQIR